MPHQKDCRIFNRDIDNLTMAKTVAAIEGLAAAGEEVL